MNVIESKQVGNYRLEVFYDEYPTNPRDDENLGVMVCSHPRYNLGDNHDYNFKDYQSWDDLKSQIIKDHNGMGIIHNLYLYDHSGISISIRPYGCKWDSGQVGFIFVPKEKVRQWYNVKRVSSVLLEELEEKIQQEVELYDKYLRGECYGYSISKVTTCEFGHEHLESVEVCGDYLDLEQCKFDGESSIKWFDEKEQEVLV